MDNNKWLIMKEGGCKRVDFTLFDYQVGGYRAYIYSISDTLQITDLLNLKISFKVQRSNGTGFQEWYPYGGVWLGFGNLESGGELGLGQWIWTGTRGPYMTIGDQQDFDCGPDGGVAGHMGVAVVGENPSVRNKWCIKNTFEIFTYFNDIPEDYKIKYLLLHVRTNSSIFWRDAGLGSEVLSVLWCVGKPAPGFCDK